MLLLSHRNTTASPWHGCIRLLKPRLLSLCEHLGLHYANISTSWSRHVGGVFRMVLGGRDSLNFDKEYLFGFETLVFATSGILSMHNQLVTLKEKGKLEIASYDPFKIKWPNFLFNWVKIELDFAKLTCCTFSDLTVPVLSVLTVYVIPCSITVPNWNFHFNTIFHVVQIVWFITSPALIGWLKESRFWKTKMTLVWILFSICCLCELTEEPSLQTKPQRDRTFCNQSMLDTL